MPAPRYLHFQLTERCNLACPGCYLPERAGQGATVADIVDNVFRPVSEVGVRFVTLTGGEPLLHPDWAGACAAAVKYFDSVQVVSNGMLLDLDAYDVLRAAGIREIKVSLDGPTAEIHDALRGKKGCFDTVTANLRAIPVLPPERRGEIDLGCICTVSPLNVMRLHETAMLVDEMGLDSILFQPYHPYGFLYPLPGAPVERQVRDEAYLEALREQLDALSSLRRARPGFLDNSLAMLDRFIEFHIAPMGPKQICGADRFVFVNSAFEIRGCLFCAPLASLRGQGMEDFRQSGAWRRFDDFRSGCTRCLMGCQFVEEAQKWTEEGFGLIDEERYKEAVAAFERSLAIEYSVASAHGLGLALFKLDRAEEARELLEKAANYRPRNLFILGDYAQILARLGDSLALEALIDQIFGITEDNAIANRQRGLILRSRGDLTAAIPFLRRGMELSPNNDPWPFFEYGLACMESGDHAEAALRIAHAVELDPGFPWFRYRHAMALHGLGRAAEAEAECRKAIELDGGPVQFHDLLKKITSQRR